MIKLFRKIRQRLLLENRFSKYLIYALGEIVLVVIGILIALQINNHNEKNKNITKEHFYLNAIYEEIIEDTISQNRAFRQLESMENAARYILRVLDDPNKSVRDTIEFLNKFKGMMVSDQQLPEPVIWQELQSTGNLSLIRDRALIKQLYAYYHRINACEEDYKNNAKPFINRARYLDSKIFSTQTQDDFFENWKIEKIPDKKILTTVLNSQEVYENTKGLLTGMLISKLLLKRVLNDSVKVLSSLEKLINNPEDE
jgi:hypothetical protein